MKQTVTPRYDADVFPVWHLQTWQRTTEELQQLTTSLQMTLMQCLMCHKTALHSFPTALQEGRTSHNCLPVLQRSSRLLHIHSWSLMKQPMITLLQPTLGPARYRSLMPLIDGVLYIAKSTTGMRYGHVGAQLLLLGVLSCLLPQIQNTVTYLSHTFALQSGPGCETLSPILMCTAYTTICVQKVCKQTVSFCIFNDQKVGKVCTGMLKGVWLL